MEKRKEDKRTKHSDDLQDNVGSVSVNTDGGISISLGGGLALDPSDGSIGIQVGGITIDT